MFHFLRDRKGIIAKNVLINKFIDVAEMVCYNKISVFMIGKQFVHLNRYVSEHAQNNVISIANNVSFYRKIEPLRLN